MPNAPSPGRPTFARAAGVIVVAAAAYGTLSARAGQPHAEPPVVQPKVTLQDATCRDQDDMCIWVHPTDASLSVVIASDKLAGRLIVYDLAGKTLESFRVDHPGNIDLRYGFPLGGRKVDVIAYNQLSTVRGLVCVYAIDPAARRLRRVDNGEIVTGHNYGGTLYRSPGTGKVYFVTTADSCQQYELFDDGAGKVAGRKVREWKAPAYTEGAVGDDETGRIYYAVESQGVYEVGGEPEDPTPGRRVVAAGANGLERDVEGIALYHQPDGKGYLLASSQGNSQFKVYRRGSWEYVGTFRLAGASSTDGVDAANVAMGEAFPSGVFACHSDRPGQCPVLLTPWETIARAFAPPLAIDTSWDPRRPAGPRPRRGGPTGEAQTAPGRGGSGGG